MSLTTTRRLTNASHPTSSSPAHRLEGADRTRELGHSRVSAHPDLLSLPLFAQGYRRMLPKLLNFLVTRGNRGYQRSSTSLNGRIVDSRCSSSWRHPHSTSGTLKATKELSFPFGPATVRSIRGKSMKSNQPKKSKDLQH